MSDFSQTTITGRLGRDPEERKYGNEGKSVTSMSIGCKNYKKVTVWYKCITFNEKQGNVWMQWLKKGSQVLVVGELQEPKIWTNKDGVAKVDLSLVVSSMTMLGAAPAASGAASGGFDDDTAPGAAPAKKEPYNDEDSPF